MRLDQQKYTNKRYTQEFMNLIKDVIYQGVKIEDILGLAPIKITTIIKWLKDDDTGRF